MEQRTEHEVTLVSVRDSGRQWQHRSSRRPERGADELNDNEQLIDQTTPTILGRRHIRGHVLAVIIQRTYEGAKWNGWDSAPRCPWLNTSSGSIPRCRLFFHSGDVLRVFMPAMTVQRGTNAQEKLKGVTEIIAVIAIETIGAIVERELRAQPDVDAFAVR